MGAFAAGDSSTSIAPLSTEPAEEGSGIGATPGKPGGGPVGELPDEGAAVPSSGNRLPAESACDPSSAIVTRANHRISTLRLQM
eukprot:m.349334 g.349334  ORF g.349334 m.349334 type:complete len:84 (+) comp16571_c1_seq5:6195-6446(+)